MLRFSGRRYVYLRYIPCFVRDNLVVGDIDLVRKIRNHLESLGLEPLMFYLKCLSDEQCSRNSYAEGYCRRLGIKYELIDDYT
jgi:hypothetical protein